MDFRRVLLSAGLVAASSAAQAQTALPEIVVTAPSPIVRAPAPRTPVPQTPATTTADAPPPAAVTALPGTLPIVTDQFATVTVVPNAELRRTPGATLGDVLFSKPGITGSSFAPGASSRPIVRGLDSYRVRIQEDGLGANGVSELAEDHAVPVDPLSANQVEVIRGPATLRYGSQAIGGVVNTTNNRIPEFMPARPLMVETRAGFTSVDRGADGAVLLDAGVGNFAFHADAFGRKASNYGIPSYPYLFPEPPAPVVGSTQPNSSMHADGQAVGGSYFFDGGFIGIAATQFSSFYRVPGLEATETNTRIDMQQTKLMSKGEFRPQAAAIEAIRFWAGTTDYQHDELANEGGFDGIQQTFTNKEHEGRLEVQFAPLDMRFATLTTAIGTQGAQTTLAAPGAEGGLFDPNRATSAAAFMFNEFKFNPTQRMQIAGRIEQVDVKGSVPDLFVDPNVNIERDLSFTPKSGAIGFLQDLPGDMVASLTAQYVERAPRGPELFSRGIHEATETFDIGNPNLDIEAAQTVEVGLRRAKGPFRFEATVYYTRFNGFIFRNLTGETCGEDFPSCGPGGAGGELNQAVYAQRDATFRGGEFQSQLDVMPLGNGMFGIENQFDIVRATFTDGSNVPRIPPVRLGGGVFWRNANWLTRVNLLHAFDQDDITENETPTAGYNLLKAEISYTTELKANGFGMREFTFGVTGDNLLNEDIRNSVSFKKDEVLMPGASVRVFANAKF
jgi:iron complex outermembrane recepter protein